MADKEFYIKQIMGLIVVIKDGRCGPDAMIAKSYVVEKLEAILHGGMNFHPAVNSFINLPKDDFDTKEGRHVGGIVGWE